MTAIIKRSCPPAGTGVHSWLFYAANRLHNADFSADEAAERLADAIAASEPCRVDRAEIRRTVAKVWMRPIEATSWPRNVMRPTKPRPMWSRIVEIVRGGPRMADLWELSPVRCDEDLPDAETIADMLFPGNLLLCVARTHPSDAVTAPRDTFRGRLSESALIVPSPMTALTGRTQDGHESPRCLQNVGPRRFLVVEFDYALTPPEKLASLSGDALEGAMSVNSMLATGLPAQDLCAALLWYLATRHEGPLVAVVSSGGKSLHGWFDVHGIDEATIAAWFRVAVRLGADPATFCPCQLVRLPEGRRDDGRRQYVVYMNADALGVGRRAA